MMKHRPDFISALLILGFICAAVAIICIAGANLLRSFAGGSADAALYHKPTWPDITSESTTKTTEETTITTTTETTGVIDIIYIGE